ncbi:hypothetical protein PR048_027962 [Dryococelus australis]|uniref:Mutator-like transposase domain-containing protein n=1 Tax=Dryococelus australis TaxID=614101 RepID=A0ABQ9GHX7_9NEOP|nr:hypothetical protein PR048_027962 [Dryococelus australis]
MSYSGRRIVDIVYLFTQIQNEKHHEGTDCSFMDMDFVKEKVNGFHCTWIFKCRVRNIVSQIMSENRENKDTYMPINETAVDSILATGEEYSQLRECSAGVDVHCMSNKTLLKHMNKVPEATDDIALQSMLDAAEAEKAIAIRDGNVDSDGVPMCTEVADGARCKRSCKTNYYSLSDVKSVLFYLCVMSNAKQTPPSYTCFLDWKKSATSMEADIIVDGFLQSEKLLGLKFNKLISEILTVCKMVDYTNFVLMLTGDRDSSVHRKLLETMP